jgi:hypothetical protein
VPGTAEGFTIVAEGAPIVRRRPLLSTPNRESVAFEVVNVVEGVVRVGVEATLYLLAWLRTEGTFVADDLDALDLLAVLL